MNMLLEQNQISELICGSNYTCILRDNSMFLPTEYKVLQSQNNSCFVKCMKMTYNGKIQFYYLTSQYQSLSSILQTINPDNFMTVVSNLLSDINDVKNNGFLSCQNIDISFEHIFVDTSNYQVKLIYIPIGQKAFPDNAFFENELRTNLVKIISKTNSLSSPKTIQLMSDLSNGMIQLDELCKRIKGNQQYLNLNSNDNDFVKDGISHPQTYCRLTLRNSASPVEINVTKDEFIIGKKQGAVDCVLTFNKMISRIHCKISKTSAGFFVSDLHSANGTFLNGIKLIPDRQCPLRNGDVVKMANSEFQVYIG